MYLLYEHHKDPSTGALLATDMLLTSRFPGTPYVNFKSATEKAIFEFCKLTFKSIHTKERTIDMDTYIWSFFGNAGQRVYEQLKASALAAAGLSFQRVENLAEQKKNGFISLPAATKIDPADFFYQQAAPSSTAPARDEIKIKLSAILNLTGDQLDSLSMAELKKDYRKAALRYHPDRNNGDAKQMTELNYWWQQWQAYAQA